MKFAVLTFLCLVGASQANIISDIWHTIEKPLEGIGEAALSNVLKHGLSDVLGISGKRDLSSLMMDLQDEVLRWMQEAHDLVEHEITEMEKVGDQPEAKVSDRAHQLLQALKTAMNYGKVEKFVADYSKDIVKQFAAMLPKRLESKVWTHTHKLSRKTRGNDILVQMLKNITVAHWFFTMPEKERQFLVAMLDATEHGHLHDFAKQRSDRILTFIDHLPVSEGHKLNHYLAKHMQQENKHNNTANVQQKPKRDVTEFLQILSEIYSEHIYSILDKEDRLFLLELMDAAEHSRLTSFIADHSMERVNKLTEGVPKEAGDKLIAFVVQRLQNETQLSHGHHGERNADILLNILKDIHTANIFFHLPESERKFVVELMDAAENNHLDAFVAKVGVQRVRDFVKHLPKDYEKVMTDYIANHLHHHTTPQPTHNPAIMLAILKDIHTAAIFMELPSSEQGLVLQLLDAAENGHIIPELAKIGHKRLQQLAHHIPSPYKEQFATYIHQHVQAEQTTTPHPALRNALGADSDDVSRMTEPQRRFYNQLKHAAENEGLKQFIRKVGVARLIQFLEGLADPFSKRLQELIMREMEEEDKVIKPLTPRLVRRKAGHDHSHGHTSIHESIHHIGEHLTDNHAHYHIDHHTFYDQLKHATQNHQLKSFLENVGTENLYKFLDSLPKEYAESLEFHILAELKKEDHVEI